MLFFCFFILNSAYPFACNTIFRIPIPSTFLNCEYIKADPFDFPKFSNILWNFGEYNFLVTPKFQISSTHSTDRKDDIPNRDSSDFRNDHANLFLINQ